MKKAIAVIKGDGIGPEIMEQAVRCLKKIAARFGHELIFTELSAGGAAIDLCGECLPKSTLDACAASDSVLLAAVGGPKWDALPGEQRPERALLNLRKELGLFANLRPAKLLAPLANACPLKTEISDQGVDIMVVRELTGGIYFGEHETREQNGEQTAIDVMRYSQSEIERISRVAFETARKRRARVCSVDKANVLDSSRLWRKSVERVAKEYPDVTLEHMYVDNAAMQLVRAPYRFDVILTENMFGDILTDEASMIAGTIGAIGSASIGEGTRGMYEPIHGSAPDIAGQDKANPTGMILAAAMMLFYAFSMEKEAKTLENAVMSALSSGARTADMMSEGMRRVGCKEFGALVEAAI